jgi:DNA-binding NarL/FixJ family response regulator
MSAANDPRGLEVLQTMLTSQEQRIVALLASGLSEKSVAVRLGASRRIVAYRAVVCAPLRALMDRLCTENRFPACDRPRRGESRAASLDRLNV